MPPAVFGDRAATREHPAWWDIDGSHTFEAGKTFTASEALSECGADYKVVKVPVRVPYGEGMIEVPDKVLLVREETHDDVARVLGIVGSKYEVIQNSDVCSAIDPLSKEWPVETIGALGVGETFFVTLSVGTTKIGPKGSNEELAEYFLVSDSKGGGRALHIAYTPVRVVCQNTLSQGLQAASIDVKMYHTGRIATDLGFRVDVMAQMKKARKVVLETMDKLTLAKVVDKQVEAIINAAYPFVNPPKSANLKQALADEGIEAPEDIATRLDDDMKRHQYWQQRLTEYRQLAISRFQVFNTEHPKVADTAWAAYQAVTETEDYRSGQKSVPFSATFGERAQRKQAAFAMAVKVAGIAVPAK